MQLESCIGRRMDGFIISVDGFELIDVLECSVHKHVNEHGRAKIRGHVPLEQVEDYLAYKKEFAWTTIRLEEFEGSSYVIFSGIITNMEVKYEGELAMIILDLCSGTSLMDYQLHKHTYQEENAKVSKILDQIKKNYGQFETKFKLESAIKEESDALFVQYDETDFQFIQRIAAYYHCPVITFCDECTIKFHIGLAAGTKEEKVDVKEYSVRKVLDEYLYKKYHELEDCTENDMTEYIFWSRTSLEVGSCVNLNGTTLFIKQVDSHLNGSEMIHSYVARKKEGFAVERRYHYQMIGSSLMGKVEEIENDMIKVSFEVDKYAKDQLQWFQFSTPYSSSDGTGWYCMPEKEDRVRLFFPTEKEKDAYAISAIHLETENNERKDPDKKSLMSRYKKQIEFSKDKLIITNNDGMLIELDDNKGITIQSDKDIIMNAKKKFIINSKSDKVEVSAKKEVKLDQSGSKIAIKTNIDVKAPMVKIQS